MLMAQSGIAADSINCSKLFTGGYVLGAGEVLTINVSKGSEGFFGTQFTFVATGAGSFKVEYQCSMLGNYWDAVTNIVSPAVSQACYRYPASGTNIFAGFQRIVITETSGTGSITFTEAGRCAQ